jgi:DNA-binding transcriptional LysR family regulator
VDIALVTRMPGFTGGQVVRQEQLIWVMGEGHDVHLAEPVPLAVLPAGNIYRDYAIEGLERQGRKWRIACVSESVGGLQAAVFAGMAVTVLCRSGLVHGMKQIGINEYFPPLPKVDLLLYRASGQSTPAATALHEYLSHYLGRLNAEGRPAIESNSTGVVEPRSFTADVAVATPNAMPPASIAGRESRPPI